MVKEILRKIIFEEFDLEQFKTFFAHKNPKFKPASDDLQYFVKEGENFEDGKKLGEVSLEDGNILFCAFRFTEKLSERSSKKSQYNLGKRILKDANFQRFNAGIFIFYDKDNKFRFSLIYDIPKGNGHRDWNNFRRFTYFVSKDQTNKTFLKQIGEGDFSTLEKIKEAFSVEKVTKEFFKELSNWYAWALDSVQFPKDAEKEKKDQKGRKIALIRFLTRIIFIWFMKQEKLVPDYLFDESKMKDILKDFNPQGEESTYYKAVLQNLFFATLNTPKSKRRFTIEKRGKKGVNSDYGNHNVYRYQELFRYPNRLKKYFEEIPFLNGGLFECLDKKDKEEDRRYIDGFTETKGQQPIFPNKLFFSKEKSVELNKFYGTKKKKYKVEGLINILKRYNFTVDENTPVDVDVALDPELLGRIFENLLASYNPETATTARKATGSYYTPRQIVHYMVDESLKAYFKAKLNKIKDIDKKLEELFSYDTEEHDFSEEEAGKLVRAIDEVRVIDPAVGSGAFPMGILQRLVYLLSKLDPENKIWKEIQKEKILKMVDKTFEKTKDKQEREKELKELNEVFSQNTSDYGRKLYLIKNCIYGVDIQPIAIQIAKLRFFISLLVDMKVHRDKKNYGIDPLPNLETKFVAANSLIGIKNRERQSSFKDLRIKTLEEKLKRVREVYFSASDIKQKKKLRKEDRDIRRAITGLLNNAGFAPESTKQLVNWNPYDSNTSANWFDPEWMFGITDGFDVVIGNPPYIQLQKRFDDNNKYADLYKDQGFKTFDRTGDIYCLFCEKGNQLLNDNGHLIFITSNKWMRAKYGNKLRKYLVENTTPKLLIDLGPGVFESATVDTNILLFQKGKRNEECIACDVKENLAKLGISLKDYVEENKIELKNFTSNAWIILSPIEQRIKEKIKKIGTPLKDWNIKINRGVLTGFNKAFIIDGKTKDELIKKDPKSVEIIKPILRGRDIKRYHAKFADKWLIASHNGYRKENGEIVEAVDIENYPAIKEWLDRYWKKISKRQDKGRTPYNLRDCAYWQEFEKEKIVYSEIVRKPQFYFDKNKFYVEATSFLMTGQNLKFLISILNSKPFTYFFKRFYAGGGLGDEGYRYKKAFLERIPIPKISPEKQKPFIKLVDQILEITSQSNYNPNNPPAKQKELETEIDQLVYKLYGLTPEEIKIIENYEEKEKEKLKI